MQVKELMRAPLLPSTRVMPYPRLQGCSTNTISAPFPFAQMTAALRGNRQRYCPALRGGRSGSRKTPIREIMTRNVVTVSPPTMCVRPRLMATDQIRRLPVVDEGRLWECCPWVIYQSPLIIPWRHPRPLQKYLQT